MKAVHVIADLYQVQNNNALKDLRVLQSIMFDIATTLRLSIVNESGHQFLPFGATSVLVLSESHFSAHTWYETKQIHMDLFTCNADALDIDRFVGLVKDAFETECVAWKLIDRPLEA
jgi:S-adenosylmethionine decarboxylase